MIKKQLKKFLKFLKQNDIILLDALDPLDIGKKEFCFNEVSQEWLFDEFYEEYNHKYH